MITGMSRRLLFRAVVSGLVLFVQFGAAGAVSAQMLHFARPTPSEIPLDPATAVGTPTVKVTYQIFDGLVRIKPGTNDVLLPALATEWSTSEDGLLWSFALREGVKFHDGTQFDSDAVVFTFRRQMDPDYRYYTDSYGYNNTLRGIVQSVTAISPYVVQIRLNKPYTEFLFSLSTFNMGIVSPESAMEKKYEVGTGPFMLHMIDNDGKRIFLQKNELYWDAERVPNIDGIVFHAVEDNQERAKMLRNGVVHIAEGLDVRSLEAFVDDSEFSVRKIPSQSVSYFAVNTSKKPFSDKRVRQAIAYLLDVPGLIRNVYAEQAITAHSFVPETIDGHNSKLRTFPRDTERARKLLAEAGYSEGFKMTLDVPRDSRSYMPEPAKLADVIASNLEEGSITVEIRTSSFLDLLDRLFETEKPDYDACLLGWNSDRNDPSDFLYPFFAISNAYTSMGSSHSNVSLFVHNRLDELVVKAQQTYDQKIRTEMYMEAQEIVNEEAPLIPIANVYTNLVVNSKVKKLMTPIVMGNYGLETVSVTEEN
ncbi:MAG: ABC transporter substrate-binding protein [bacterium]|nr:ABC transporter substrate-binding protein [bacterium]